MEHHVSGAVLLHSPTTNSYRGTLALSEGCDLSYSHSVALRISYPWRGPF